MPRSGKAPRIHRNKAIFAERRLTVLRMRQAGLPLREIAERAGISLGTAFSDLKFELERLKEMRTEEGMLLLDLQNSRLEDLWRRAWSEMAWRPATKRNEKGEEVLVEPEESRDAQLKRRLLGIETLLKINKAICRLNGLDAQESHDREQHDLQEIATRMLPILGGAFVRLDAKPDFARKVMNELECALLGLPAPSGPTAITDINVKEVTAEVVKPKKELKKKPKSAKTKGPKGNGRRNGRNGKE